MKGQSVVHQTQNFIFSVDEECSLLLGYLPPTTFWCSRIGRRPLLTVLLLNRFAVNLLSSHRQVKHLTYMTSDGQPNLGNSLDKPGRSYRFCQSRYSPSTRWHRPQRWPPPRACESCGRAKQSVVVIPGLSTVSGTAYLVPISRGVEGKDEEVGSPVTHALAHDGS